MSSSHTLEQTSEGLASPDASSTPPSELGQTAALGEYTQLFCRHSPERLLKPASPPSFGEQQSDETPDLTRPGDAYHEHEESHSSVQKNQDGIAGQEFTITIALGPRGLPHSLVTHKSTVSCGERKEQALDLDSSQGKITIAWTISCAGADTDADTTTHGRPGQASRKRRMGTQAS